MPVRSINLKLVVPRGPDGVGRRRALWTTHAEINAATRYYEQWLLRMRCLPYETGGDPAVGNGERRRVSAEEIERQALEAARASQRTNIERSGEIVSVVGTDAEIIAAIKALYRHMIPDETGAGAAQDANGYLSPLTDPNSKGFASAAAKLDRPPPNWLTLADDDAALLDVANDWFRSDVSASWRSDTGSPAAWLRAARKGDPSWPGLFRRKLSELARVSAEGPEAAAAVMRKLHLLPLFPPYFPRRMAAVKGGVTPWDRMAFRLAAAHLLSWQAWVRRAADEYAARRAKLQEYRDRAVTPEIEACLGAVRTYEVRRGTELSGLGLGPASYQLLPRQLRGWQDLRDQWRRLKDPTKDALWAVAADQQTKKRGRFGDPHVFLWLSEPDQHVLWRDNDVVTVATTLNAMQALIERSHETAAMTLPDARLHPRAVQWSAAGDSNLPPYRIRWQPDEGLHASLSLLQPLEEDGRLEETATSFKLAASDQFRVLNVGQRNKKALVEFTSGADQTFKAVIGSADLLFDRHHTGQHESTTLASGDVGSIWLKVALDVDLQMPDGWSADHARFTRHFAAALGKPTKAETAVRAGARVLSVDLGIRTFAACAVFMLQDGPSTKPLSFPVPVAGGTMWAVHERSFPLNLPGEEPQKDGVVWRRTQREELQRIRRAFRFYRGLVGLSGLQEQERQGVLTGLQEAIAGGDAFPFQAALFLELANHRDAPLPIWNDDVTAALRQFRQGMGPIIRHWRRAGRERHPFNHLGKSMWAVEYLTDVRRTLLSWSLLGRARGDVRRQDRSARGVFAARLLNHIDNIKEDRLKTGADLIVRAAMGYVRDRNGRWEQRFAPCDAVLFEDLTRYRMRTDRPRRENSQLMRWAHRAVPAEVTMQGALHGLEVVETSAAFSSRYHARSLTPGIRCQPLAAADLGDEFLSEELAEVDIALEDCRAGDLVPRRGGQMFVCLTAKNELVRVDADINAAQNLQRRYWTRHAEAFRLPCVPAMLDGQQVWVPRQMGKRLLGALGGTGVLRPTGQESGSARWEQKKASLTRSLFQGDDAEPTSDAEIEELSALAEEAEVQAGKVEVFFRDPSGVILPNDLWYPSKTFWGIVSTRSIAALKNDLAVGGRLR